MSHPSKVLLATLLAFTGLSIAASAAEKVIFRIDRKPIEFIQDYDRRLMLSSGCKTGEPKPEFSCQAFDALSRISLKPIRKYLKGGKNPGAVICRYELKAQVVLGRDPKGNQNTFCKLADNSYVDNGTLAGYARENDQAGQ